MCNSRDRDRSGSSSPAGAGLLALALAVLAVRHFAETPWPLSRGHPGLLAAAGFLCLIGYGFKAFGWQQLFATHAVQAVGILVGGSICLLATAWRTGLRLAPHHVAPAAVLGSRP